MPVGHYLNNHDMLQDDRESQLEHLKQVIDHAAHLLPAQGPINVFIHHNTLHAFEDLPFDEAVQTGARVFGCHPYLPEERYRAELARGRILPADLLHVLQDDLGDRGDERVLSYVTRFQLRLGMLEHPMLVVPDAELRWFVAVTDSLKQFRPDAAGKAEMVIAKTRRWVMRDVHRPGANGQFPPRDRHLYLMLNDLLADSAIENWDQKTWESFSLHAMWRICRSGVHGVKRPAHPTADAVRHCELLREATGEDADLLVNEVLIRFCATFLDQGLGHWHLPHRADGFFQTFCALYRQPLLPSKLWMSGLARELARLENKTGLESIQESLEMLDVSPGELDQFLSDTFLALRGWAGMIRQVESRGDRVAQPIPKGSLVEYLAVRLILERLAIKYLARKTLGFHGELRDLRHAARQHIFRDSVSLVDQRAFLVFQLAQIFGWSPDELHKLTPEQWSQLVLEAEAFSSMERRRIFHHAYERSFRNQTLDAIALHQSIQADSEGSLLYADLARPVGGEQPPRFQIISCIDDREESLRRHLEELAPDIETLSAAGFYGVAMYYRGTEDAHFVPLCPIVIRPNHWVSESVVDSEVEVHLQRAKTRRAIGTASHQVHVGSRTFTGGVLLAAGLGVLASVPLVGRILFPRLTARIRSTAAELIKSPDLTKLDLERSEATAGPDEGHIGFSIEEMAGIVERLLRDMGLTSRMSRLIVVVGHGSRSLNNPHNSAYECGACGGGAGGPNARALSRMANDPRVREIVAARGVQIPNDTVFVGGIHNTCNDRITLFDVDAIPASHQQEYEEVRKIIDEACDRNAHERCRRFQSAPLTMTFSEARRHVEDRSEDLAQTRPECGHATNAICIVGRRQRTRGLFLDRRAFLTSYDPTQDDADSKILAGILGAVFPVCAGINLEYYFSYVDNVGFGCGVKLPHNVTALLGVMDGAASDLRTGLPWQMVEIHEPVRLLFVIETTPERMLKIMSRNEGINRLCRNGWVQLATLDPDSATIHFFRHGEFQIYQPQAANLPVAASSVDWYRGWRDHLEFAEIGAVE